MSDTTKMSEPLGIGCGPAVPATDSSRDVADKLYELGKKLYESDGSLSSYELQQMGGRIKFLCTVLHGKLAGK